MKNFLVIPFVILVLHCNAQIPSGYYDSAQDLVGEELREELHDIIDDHDQQSYGSLWNHFEFTDEKSNGKVWDMYSTNADGTADYEYTFGSDQCGNYGGEGDCYNREHSVPASWYNDGYPMYSDLFHLYPTDGWTNGIRSAYPFGEVQNASVTTSNGCKRGANTYPGYTGIVFEPIDEYKGDFARTYFYIVTRYMDVMSSWNSSAFEGDNLSEWQRNMLLEWHWNDPVSDKELARNNTVYLIQENRNPYIDHPEWVDLIWESTSSLSEFEVRDLKFEIVNGHLDIQSEWEKLEVISIDGKVISSMNNLGESKIELPGNQIMFIRIYSQSAILTEKIFLVN